MNNGEILLYLWPVVLLVAFIWANMNHSSYRKHERNPYIRFCKRCGQQQSVWCNSWDLRKPGSGWWEQMGDIADVKCKCHKDCTDYKKFLKTDGYKKVC